MYVLKLESVVEAMVARMVEEVRLDMRQEDPGEDSSWVSFKVRFAGFPERGPGVSRFRVFVTDRAGGRPEGLATMRAFDFAERLAHKVESSMPSSTEPRFRCDGFSIAERSNGDPEQYVSHSVIVDLYDGIP